MKALGYAVIFLASLAVLVLASLRLCFVEPGELTQPVSIGEVSFLADGGSMAVELQGANGKRFFAGRHGSLDVELARQPMFAACNCFGIPYARNVVRGDERERAIQALLEAWIAANITAEDRTRFEARSQMHLIPGKALGVLEMLNWIKERQ
ncbi:hypothetical protein [Variovorax sp. V15]|uniref:hypothetical protein n=1 Tax=Variovorax sp. V15 TaxID=3065952 RepID=UPI0034E8EB7E